MGIIGRIKRLFSKNTSDGLEIESKQELQDQEYASQYQNKKETITAEVMDELLANQEPLEPDVPEQLVISEYDVGEVEFDELSSDDSVDHSNKNVIEYESLDTIVEHLEDVEIMGDISTEVTFESL